MIQVLTSPQFQPEKDYIFQVLLGEILGLEYQVIYSPEVHDFVLELPNGCSLIVKDHFWKNKSGGGHYATTDLPVLVRQVPHPFHSAQVVQFWNDDVVYQQVSETQGRLGLDIFAAAFFMLTRWEEQVITERDVYGRFPAAASLAYRFQFLNRPVVQEWADVLWHCLIRLGFAQPAKQHAARLVLSCDVDHPRLWWNRANRLKTMAGALFRPDTLKEWQYWYQNWLFSPDDPWDTFDLLMDIGERNNTPVQFNFLSERPRHFDCWYPLRHPFITDLMRRIHARGHQIGFHPSREAHADDARFEQELNALRAVAPQEIVAARHHYLCFDAPLTWRRMAAHGIKIDSTCGYSDYEGFRCGTAVSFTVFDTQKRQGLPLKEQPLLAMDVTLAQYQAYTPAQAIEKLGSMTAQVKRFGGDMTLLWHNSSLNTPFWQYWRPVLLSANQG